MNYLSTTDLRTKSAKLRDSLKKGKRTFLLHRSKVIGVVEPYERKEFVSTEKNLKKFIESFHTGKNYSYKKRNEMFQKHLEGKYGENIP